MLAAGVAWAALWWHLGRARDRGSLDAAAIPAAAGAALAAVLTLAARWGVADVGLAFAHGGFWLYAVGCLVAAAAALLATRSGGPRAVAAATFLPAAALTALTIIEQATGAFGPQPILLGPASAGIVLALAGALLVWPRGHDAAIPSASRVCRASVVVSIAALVAAAAGLALPALEGRANGLLSSGSKFEASFILRGIEVVGPWAALALALGALGMALSRRVTFVHAAALVAAGIAWPFVWATPLHTLTTFIPSEVQVDFGSEFAAISFRALSVPATHVALGGAASALALLLLCRQASGTQVRDALPRGDRP